MNFDIMSGIPHKASPTVTAMEMNFMQLWEHPVRLTAEAATLPDSDEAAVKLTLSAKAGEQELTRSIYAPPMEDHVVMLFQLAMMPSDYFVNSVMVPFVQNLCDALGKPMIRVIKPA